MKKATGDSIAQAGWAALDWAVERYRRAPLGWLSFFSVVIVVASVSVFLPRMSGDANSLMAVRRAAIEADGAPPVYGDMLEQSPAFTSSSNGSNSNAFITSTSGLSSAAGNGNGLYQDVLGTSSDTPEELINASRALADAERDAVTVTAIEKRELEDGEETPILYFDGRPVRPVKRITMTVTAYSPDARSCAPFDDGYTASGYSVWTNGMKLIAADKTFDFGALLSVPGYNGNRPTPVLDRGAAIKGNRLDVLFPTHEEALEWGRREITVTMWEYADEFAEAETAGERG